MVGKKGRVLFTFLIEFCWSHLTICLTADGGRQGPPHGAVQHQQDRVGDADAGEAVSVCLGERQRVQLDRKR